MVVDGVDVRAQPVAVKRRIAVVPQLSNLDRSLTALENLTFHAAYFGTSRRERRKQALRDPRALRPLAGAPTTASTTSPAAWRSG